VPALTVKSWAEIVVLATAMLFLSAVLAWFAVVTHRLQHQADDRDRRVTEYFQYVHRRDAEWGPHILAIPVEPK
jgi:hypothetical protein